MTAQQEVLMEWQPISERPELDEQPCRQFIRLEGSRYHSGLHWHRIHCGEAYIRKPGSDDEKLQYRKADIMRLCKDGDMDPGSAEVTHWMPAIFPPMPTRMPTKDEMMSLHDRTMEMLRKA